MLMNMVFILLMAMLFTSTIAVVYGSYYLKDSSKLKSYFWGTEKD